MSEGQGKEEKDTDGQNKGSATEIKENHVPGYGLGHFFSFWSNTSVLGRLQRPF